MKKLLLLFLVSISIASTLSSTYVDGGIGNRFKLSYGKWTPILIYGLEINSSENLKIGIGPYFGTGISFLDDLNMFVKLHVGIGSDFKISKIYDGISFEYFCRVKSMYFIFGEVGAYKFNNDFVYPIIIGVKYLF